MMSTRSIPRFALIAAMAAILSFTSCDTHQSLPAATGPAPEGNIVQNPGFEIPGDPAPEKWFQDVGKTGKHGAVSLDRTKPREGSSSLQLRPNSRNNDASPLAIAQILPTDGLQGRQVEFSGWLSSEGGATAALGLLSIVKGKLGNLEIVTAQGAEWERVRGVYTVPSDGSTQLILTTFVAGTSGSAWFDGISVEAIAPPGQSASPVPAPAGNVLTAAIEVDAGSVVRTIPRTLYGTNVEWIWSGNFLFDEGSGRLDPEAVSLARQLGVSLIRYPGGLYSDFYHWKQGVGPRDRRPEMLHEAGKKDRSRPNLGTDEALAFAQAVGGELLITVNAGTGTAAEAADWVRHVNGDSTRVRYWEIGNELYIRDSSPVSKATTIGPKEYAARLTEFATRMKAVDGDIRIGAIGGENYGRYSFVGYPDWNRTVLESVGSQIDFFSIHNAYAPVLTRGGEDLREVYTAMLAAPTLIAENLETVSQQIERHAPGRDIGIAVTEWGPVFSFDPGNRYVDHAKTLGSALFVASTLKTFVESPRTRIANFFLLNDVSVLGWIGSRNGEFPPDPKWIPSARYYAFQLYTRHFGDRLIRSRTESPTFDSKRIGHVEAVKGVPYLDVVASLSEDGQRLHLIAINKHFDSPIEAAISIRGFTPASTATAWTLNGTGIDAHTGTTPLRVPGLRWAKQVEDPQHRRFSRGGSEEVSLTSAPVGDVSGTFKYRFPAHSATSLILTRSN